MAKIASRGLALAITTVGWFAARPSSDLTSFPDASGWQATWRIGGSPGDLATGPFFQALGPNGRGCGSCHRAAQGWTISAEEIEARFEATKGLDPIFRISDGSNCDHGGHVTLSGTADRL